MFKYMKSQTTKATTKYSVAVGKTIVVVIKHKYYIARTSLQYNLTVLSSSNKTPDLITECI